MPPHDCPDFSPSFRSRRVIRRGTAAGVLLALLATVLPIGAEDAPTPVNLADYYGFGPLEIMKLSVRSHSMVHGDFNSDGRGDLAIVDNSHSRIDILLQRETAPDAADPAPTRDVNAIDNHWRFDLTKLPVDREVSAMVAGDFNSDGKADLAYFGNPDRLVVRYQGDDQDWSKKWEVRLADVSVSTWGIISGDFNGDGRSDLAVLGTKDTYLLLQTDDGFSSPVAIRNTAENLSLGMAGDFDGDGLEDLFYTATANDESHACVRLQTAQHTLGPEYRLEIKDPYGVTVRDMLGDGQKEILAIDSQTERLNMYRVVRPRQAEEPESKPIQYGVGAKGSGTRDIGVGDLDGDGLTDVVVSDPDSAQLIVYRQDAKSGLDLGTPYASFLGVEQLRVRDLNGDGKAEVIALSSKEKTLGICGMDEGRLTFPRALPMNDEVLCFDLADLNSDSVPEVVCIVKQKEGRSDTRFLLRALTIPATGDPQPYVFGEDQTELTLDIRDAKRLQTVDANGDGRPDLLVLIDLTRAPTLFVTNEQGIPEPVTGTGGVQLAEVEDGSIFAGMLEGEPALLIAQGTFSRRMKLDSDNRWQVLDQYNAGESTAKVKGSAILDLDGKPGEEIVLVDTGAGKVRLLRKQGELFAPWRIIDLGTFPYQSVEVADLNGDKRDDLLFFGGTRFAVLYTGQTDPDIELLATYESQREDAFVVDMTCGDLNADGLMDMVVLDHNAHAVDIVACLPKPEFRLAINFKVFEEKSFQDSGSSGLEPREMLVEDVTGDGRDDLLMLVHDRLLLYPQSTPPAPAGLTATESGQP